MPAVVASSTRTLCETREARSTPAKKPDLFIQKRRKRALPAGSAIKVRRSGASSKCENPSKLLTTSAMASEVATALGREPYRAESQQRCPQRKQCTKAPFPASTSGRMQSSGSMPYRKSIESGSSSASSENSESALPLLLPLPSLTKGSEKQAATAKQAAIQPSSACTLTATHAIRYQSSRLITAPGKSTSVWPGVSLGGGSRRATSCALR
mmetsp:Transcript_20851/g.52898  ORF Transcript_20851/g.52898 Transcript_20851/m.52898 type:complete len:211 (+) Transcript_20851:356-988(+)